MDTNFIRILIGKENGKYTDEQLQSISPKILRDLYLRRIYDGTIQGPLTGDIYKDKPWVQNYPEKANGKFLFDDTMYNTYIRETSNKLDEIAIITLDGKKYTHRDFRQLLQTTAAGLLEKGLKEGSRIGILLANSIEEPTTVLATSAIGGNARMVDYSKGPFDAKKSIEEANLEVLVLDEMLMPMEPLINQKKLPVIVANARNKYEEERFITFEELLELGKGKEITPVSKNPNRVALTITSSGTTGVPKPIMHSDKTVNDSVQGFIHTDFPLGENTVMIKSIPGFIGLGVITTMYASLVTGTPLLLVGGASPEEMTKKTTDIIINYDEFKKKNGLPEDFGLMLFSAPIFARDLYGRYDEIKDLSHVKAFMVAGSKMLKEELDEMEKAFAAKGMSVPVNNAYGQNEQGGGVTTNSPKHNKNGSAGYPLIGRNVYIVNQDTLDVIKENANQGLIVEETPTMFLGYENMPEKTAQTKLYLEDGKMTKENNGGVECFNSEDLGEIDANGFVSVTGRISRVLVRFDCKMPIEKIEGKMKNIPGIKECAMVSLEGSSNSYDLGVAFVELDDSIENAREYIDMIQDDMEQEKLEITKFEKPDLIIPVDSIPYMSNGKVNYKQLKETAKGYQEQIEKGIELTKKMTE